MIQAEHHYQRVDLEGGGFIEATRDDTDEIQDCHYSVWKDGRQILAGWVIYNIQYDYSRVRTWWYGRLYYDYLESDETYGHFSQEFSYLPPEKKRYPYDWEPVTPRGSDYFHEEGVTAAAHRLLECNVRFSVRFYILKDITNPNKLNPPLNLITGVKPLTPETRRYAEEDEKKRKEWDKELEKDPQKWEKEDREWRLKFLREHSEYIGVLIPYDSRFID